MSDKSFHVSMLVAAIILLMAAALLFYGELVPSPSISLAVYTLALLLGLSVHLVERYFSKPADVIVNAASVLLVFLPLMKGESLVSPTYWVIVLWAASVMLFAATALLLLNTDSTSSWRNGLSYVFKDLSTKMGSGRLLFGFAIFALIFFHGNTQDPFMISAALVSLGHLVLEKSHLPNFRNYFRGKKVFVGEIVGTTGRGAFKGRLPAGSSVPVELVFSRSGGTKTGNTISFHRTLNELLIEFIEVPKKLPEGIERPSDGTFIQVDPVADDNVIGYVTAGTTVSELKFHPREDKKISVGNIIEIDSDDRIVYFQIQDGEIRKESVDAKNEANIVSASAAQLGMYDENDRVFKRYDWLPESTALVRKPTKFPNVEIEVGEYLLGVFPGTKFPVYINVREAITHHCAILGVTGTGKSVFCREFIRRTAFEGIKYICVDITNEYASRFGDDIVAVVSDVAKDKASKIVDYLIEQRWEFANKRDHARIAKSEKDLLGSMKAEISSFCKSDKNIGLVEFADLSGTIQSYEYLKWFFQGLMELAREGEFEETVICVVLEEAHTVVPEWNFVADGDKSVSLLLNSIAQIALQGRKYGVGLMVIAQRTANVSKTILTQCNTVIAFQQFDRTSSDFLESFVGGDAGRILPNLKPRTAIATGKGLRSSTPVIFAVPEIVESSPEQVVEQEPPNLGIARRRNAPPDE